MMYNYHALGQSYHNSLLSITDFHHIYQQKSTNHQLVRHMLLYAHRHTDFSDESRLISHLLRKLNPIGPLARPVTNSSLAVPVQFSMSLVQILDFAETRQLLITNVWKNFVSLVFVCLKLCCG